MGRQVFIHIGARQFPPPGADIAAPTDGVAEPTDEQPPADAPPVQPPPAEPPPADVGLQPPDITDITGPQILIGGLIFGTVAVIGGWILGGI